MYFVVAGMKNLFCLLSHYYGLYLYILWHKFYLIYVWKLNYSTSTFILIWCNYLAFSNDRILLKKIVQEDVFIIYK